MATKFISRKLFDWYDRSNDRDFGEHNIINDGIRKA